MAIARVMEPPEVSFNPGGVLHALPGRACAWSTGERPRQGLPAMTKYVLVTMNAQDQRLGH